MKRDLMTDLKSIQEGRTLFDDPDPSVGTKYELYEVAEQAIERALEAEAKLDRAQDIIQRWFDGEISAFGVMDALIIDLGFDIDGIPDEVLEYLNIKRKEVMGEVATDETAKEVLGDE